MTKASHQPPARILHGYFINTGLQPGVCECKELGAASAAFTRCGKPFSQCEISGLVVNAALMKPGKNVLGLTVPAAPLTAGIIYDYLRLGLDENAEPPK